jgi:hypothetical protein
VNGFVAIGTAHNRTVYAAPAVAGLVFRSLGHSAALHSYAHSRHIFAVAGNLRFPLSQPQKRRKQPERYAQLVLKLVDNIILKLYNDKNYSKG